MGNIFGKTINGTKIDVVFSDISDETTDSIVNSTNASFLLIGGLSKAIVSKGGSEIAQESKRLGTLSSNGAITRAGKLRCRYIIHVLSPSDLFECQTAVHAALKLATSNALQSISFPPICCGLSGLQCNQVASCIASEVVKSARANSLGSITLVRLVGYNANEFASFNNALQTAVSGVATFSGNPLPINSSGKSMTLPTSWKLIGTNYVSKQVEVQPFDSDYNIAKRLFTLSNVTLHHVYRIQNPSLYKQFSEEKSKMEKIYEGHWRYNSPIERVLYHGTNTDTLNLVNGNGFDRNYCGLNATRYGAGSYFARDMSYSADARYSPPDGAGHKYIYAARVLVGVYCKGDAYMNYLPNKPSGYPFDSAVDDIAAPSIFVIFRDARAYPLYLYEFS